MPPIYTHAHLEHAPTLCSFRSPQPSLALRCLPASPALRASLATSPAASFARRACCELCSPLLACAARAFAPTCCSSLLLAPAARFAPAPSPATRSARLAFCSLRSPPLLLFAPLALTSACSARHLSCCSLRSPPCLLLSLRSPLRLLLSVSLRSPFRLLMLLPCLALALPSSSVPARCPPA